VELDAKALAAGFDHPRLRGLQVGDLGGGALGGVLGAVAGVGEHVLVALVGALQPPQSRDLV
jgi:hypothetical protein